MNPNVLIYGAESVKCPSFSAAMKAGKPVYTKASSTLADGLAVPLVSHESWQTRLYQSEDMAAPLLGHQKLQI